MAGCKHCSTDDDYFDGEFSRHRCPTANDEIERLTRERDKLGEQAGHEAKLCAQIDSLRAALERITCLPKYEPVTTAKEIAYEALRGAAETTDCPTCRLPVQECVCSPAVKTEGSNT